jgi:DNA end-binding protein Ku
MKSIKNTYLHWGPANVPVRMYKATDDHDIHFHRYHKATLAPIRQLNIAEGQFADDGQPLVVAYADVIDGIEVDGKLVTVSTDEKKSLEEEVDNGIEVLQAVQAGDIDPILFEDTYFLDANKGGGEGYALLRQVLSESNRMFVVRFAYRTKVHQGVVRVLGDALVIHTMRWADEIRSTDELNLPAALDQSNPKTVKMVKLAHQLVDAMVEEFNIEDHVDGYTQRLGDFINAKANDTEYVATPGEVEPTEDVSDLLAQLEASVAKKAKSKKAKKA